MHTKTCLVRYALHPPPPPPPVLFRVKRSILSVFSNTLHFALLHKGLFFERPTIIPEKFQIHTTTTTCLRTEPIITARMGVWTLTALRSLYVGPLSHNITPEKCRKQCL